MVESNDDLLGNLLEESLPRLCNDRSELGKIAHLKSLASRLESFLLVQIDRLERSGEREAVVCLEDHLSRQLDEFQQEREDWEIQRQRDVDRLRREATMLAEAWQRLESEQRSLLAEHELLRQGLARSSRSTLSQDAGPSISQPADSATRGVAASSANEQDPTAWVQFQQLRREMQRCGQAGT